MNTRTKTLAALLLLVISLLMMAPVFASCQGATARQTVTLPSMRNSWNESIEPAAKRQASTQQEQEAITAVAAALASSDFTSSSDADWNLVANLVRLDIAARHDKGILGPGRVQSLNKEVDLFLQARQAMIGGVR